MELKFLAYPHKDTVLFRGVEKGRVDKARTPVGPTAIAFRRKDNEEDGPTVAFSPDPCHRLSNIVAVAQMRVASINATVNPRNGQPLTVIHDEPDHAFIANVPERSLAEQGTLDEIAATKTCWTRLAMSAVLIDDAENIRARERWIFKQRQDETQAAEQDPRMPLR